MTNPRADTLGDPWIEAWRQLEAFITSGATEEQVTAYARELGRGLSREMWHPQGAAQQANAVQQVTQEILTIP